MKMNHMQNILFEFTKFSNRITKKSKMHSVSKCSKTFERATAVSKVQQLSSEQIIYC